MKILIYGAGVIGSIFAYKLNKAGIDVSILARGKKLEDLKKQGIFLRDDIAHEDFHGAINVVEQLNPDDYYDLVLIIMQRQQVGEILPILKNNRKIPTYVFIGNNVNSANDYLSFLDEKRILLGFGSTGGYREDHLIITGYLDQVRLHLGEISGIETDRLIAIKKVFDVAGIQVEISDNIDAWLKCHAAIISPLALAAYSLDDIGKGITSFDWLLDLAMKTLKENLKALKDLGIPIYPKKLKTLSYIPTSIIKKKFKKMFNSDLARIFLLGHAKAAKTEMMKIVHDFTELIKDTKVDLKSNKKLSELNPIS